MDSMVNSEILVTISSKKDDGGLECEFTPQDRQLEKLIKANKKVFEGMAIDCSVRSITSLREVAREKLVSINDVRNLSEACSSNDFEKVKEYAEICFVEKNKDILIKHFMKCHKSAVEKYGVDLATQRLFNDIKGLGKTTSSHLILSMEEI